MKKRKWLFLTLCVLAALAAGCASAKPTQFYTLSPVAEAVSDAALDCSVSVGPVSIPALVDRPQIVLQTGPNRVFLAEFDRWASPLKSDIARIIAENLALLLKTPRITIFPQSTSDDATYRVVIDIVRFETSAGAAIIDAVWRVSLRADGPSQNGRTKITESASGGSYDELVAAHSRALAKLSAELAATIRRMQD